MEQASAQVVEALRTLHRNASQGMDLAAAVWHMREGSGLVWDEFVEAMEYVVGSAKFCDSVGIVDPVRQLLIALEAAEGKSA